MNGTAKNEREAITARLSRLLEGADDKTLEEIERLVWGWMSMKRRKAALSKK